MMKYNQRAIFVSDGGNPFSGKEKKTVISPSVASSSLELDEDAFYKSVRKVQREHSSSDNLRLWGYITEVNNVLNRRKEIVNSVDNLEFVEDVSLFDSKYESKLEVEFNQRPDPEQIDTVVGILGYDSASDANYETNDSEIIVKIRWIQQYDSEENEAVEVRN